MKFRQLSLMVALRTWGPGLSWILAILVAWFFLGLTVQFLDEFAIVEPLVIRNGTWLNAFAILLGGTLGSWCWICYRLVLSAEPVWQRSVWVGAFLLGCYWLAATPFFDEWRATMLFYETAESNIYNFHHLAAVLAIIGAIWLVHPLFQEIQWSQSRETSRKPSRTVWLNRWVLRGVAVAVTVYGGRAILYLVSNTRIEEWQLELCQPAHFAIVVVAAMLMMLPLRLLAITQVVWVQCLLWTVMVALLCFVVFHRWAFALEPLLGGTRPARAFAAAFLLGVMGVLCLQQWSMGLLGFRVVVPRTGNAVLTASNVHESLRAERKTMRLACVGTVVLLLGSVTGLTAFRQQFFLASFCIEPIDQMHVSRFFAQCQAWCRSHPIREEDRRFLAGQHGPLQMRYSNDQVLNMMVTKSMNEAPHWEAFRQTAEQEFPMSFSYVFPISNADELAGNREFPVIWFDQEKIPLHTYVTRQLMEANAAEELIVTGGEVTTADLQWLSGAKLRFEECRFPMETDFEHASETMASLVEFHDCQFAAGAFSSLLEAQKIQRTLLFTEHAEPIVDPKLLMEAIYHGVEVIFKDLNEDSSPEWLANELANRGSYVRTERGASGLSFRIAFPWDLLVQSVDFPPSLAGSFQTNVDGKLLGIYWGNFGDRDIPTTELRELRERPFEVPWLVISGSELTLRAEPRLATLYEIARKSRFIEFTDLTDPTAITAVADLDVREDRRPVILNREPSEGLELQLQHLPWVQTVVLVDVVPETLENVIESHVNHIPALTKLVLLDPRCTQQTSYEWRSAKLNKAIQVEVVPLKAASDWRASLGLEN